MGLLNRWLGRVLGGNDEEPARPVEPAEGRRHRAEPASSDPVDATIHAIRANLTLDDRGRRYADGPDFLVELTNLDALGRSRAADGLLADALLVSPSTQLRRRLAERLLHRGERPEARTLLESLQDDPEHAAFALVALGELCEAAGEDGALDAYERVLAIDIGLAQPKARARRLRAARESQRKGARQATSALTRFLGARAAGSRYAVLEEVGRGGAATVFRARDREIDREVALKIFHPRGRAGERRARIVREARIAASFDHPHIVPVLDVDEGRDLLVMMICDDGSLRTRLSEGRLRLTDCAETGSVLLRTLADIHDAGSVHLDIKPSNLLFHEGRMLICDFGTAGLVELGAAAGTRAYMSPEQRARGQVTPAADMYAAGLLLFESLTGHLPAGHQVGRPEIELTELDDGPHRRALERLLAELTAPDPGQRLTDGRVAATRLLEAAALPADNKEGQALLEHLEMLARREGSEAETRLSAHPLVAALRG